MSLSGWKIWPSNLLYEQKKEEKLIFVHNMEIFEIIFLQQVQVKFKEENTSALNEDDEGQIHIFDFNSKIARNYTIW